MPKYICKGLLAGKEVKRELEASNKKEVLRLCEAEGIIPLEIKEISKKGLPLPFKGLSPKRSVSSGDLAFAMVQLSVLLEAGVPLVKALEILSKQVESERLSSALIEVKTAVERGEQVGKAFAKTGIFPRFLTEMLSSVQTAENLEIVFKIAGFYLEKMEEVKSRVVSAVSYPAVVIFLSFGAVIVAVKFVLPKMAAVLQSFGKSLPLITKAVVFLVNSFLALPLLLPLLWLLFWKFKSSLSEESLGKLWLKTPVFGKISLYLNLARFAAVMAMLLKVATPLNQALKLAAESVSNPYLRSLFLRAVPEVERGKSLSKLLQGEKFLPPLFVNLIATGEESGELDRMFDTLSKTYEKYTYRTIDFWVSMVEPITIILIAVIVGVVIVSVMLPLVEISTGGFAK